MSIGTLRAIEDAIAAHNADEGDGIVTNWVIAIETRRHDDDPNVSSWGNDYITSDASPNAHHGLSRWLLNVMEDIMLGDSSEDD